MDKYKLDIHLVNHFDEFREDDPEHWEKIFLPNLGKYTITENWMISDEQIGDCSTVMETEIAPIFFDSIKDCCDFIFHEYRSNTKEVFGINYYPTNSTGSPILEMQLGGYKIDPDFKDLLENYI